MKLTAALLSLRKAVQDSHPGLVLEQVRAADTQSFVEGRQELDTSRLIMKDGKRESLCSVALGPAGPGKSFRWVRLRRERRSNRRHGGQ